MISKSKQIKTIEIIKLRTVGEWLRLSLKMLFEHFGYFGFELEEKGEGNGHVALEFKALLGFGHVVIAPHFQQLPFDFSTPHFLRISN